MSIEANIQKDFGSFQFKVAFQAENEVLGILGGSGCGKSMTLRCIAGIVKPDAGRIVVDGVTFFDSEQKIDLSPQERQVGLLFQNYALFSNMTVEENIAAGVRQKLKKQEKLALAAPYLKKFRLEGLEKRLPRELSGGQQQRVAIARALALKPDILCFDEPTSALDPELTGEVLRVIRSLADQHTTMIIVTHEMAFARDVADHVVFMDGGTIVEEGTPTEVFENTHNERTRAFLSRFSQNS